MAGIAEAMSKMSGGKRGGISEAMERPEMKREPEEEGEEGGVAEHLKAMHSEMGGKHIHAHAHEGGLTSHQIGDDGNMEGPQDHESIEALKQHMDAFFNEEEQEQPSEDHSDGLM